MKTPAILLFCCLVGLSLLVMPANSLAQSFPVDTFHTDHGKIVSITCIKHGSLMVSVDNHVVQIDPVSRYADYTLFPKASLVLITHEHGDHLEAKTIDAVSTEKTLLVGNASSITKLGKGKVLGNGQQLVVSDGFSLKAVPAYNSTPERQQFHPKQNGNGYVLTIDGFSIYVAGDTELIPEMDQLKDIDVVFLPINLPYTMTVDQAVQAAKQIKPQVLYPYHYGSTVLTPLQEALKNSGVEVRIRGME